MASVATSSTDFVSLVAEEIVAGIDYATEYWPRAMQLAVLGWMDTRTCYCLHVELS